MSGCGRKRDRGQTEGPFGPADEVDGKRYTAKSFTLSVIDWLHVAR